MKFYDSTTGKEVQLEVEQGVRLFNGGIDAGFIEAKNRKQANSGVKLTDNQRKELRNSGMKNCKIAEFTRDRYGYPQYKITGISVSTGEHLVGWWYDCESAEDIKWWRSE